MANRGKKIERKLAARVAGYTGDVPDPSAKNAATKPGSKNARKAA